MVTSVHLYNLHKVFIILGEESPSHDLVLSYVQRFADTGTVEQPASLITSPAEDAYDRLSVIESLQ